MKANLLEDIRIGDIIETTSGHYYIISSIINRGPRAGKVLYGRSLGANGKAYGKELSIPKYTIRQVTDKLDWINA